MEVGRRDILPRKYVRVDNQFIYNYNEVTRRGVEQPGSSFGS